MLSQPTKAQTQTQATSAPEQAANCPTGPTLIASSTTVCLGDSVTLDAFDTDSGVLSGCRFTWSASPGPLPAPVLIPGYRFCTLVVAPTVTTTYTVTGSCNHTATVKVVVTTNCCETAGLSVPPITVPAGTYTTNPFNAPQAGKVYQVQGDIHLAIGTHTIQFAKVLMAPGASIYVEEGAALVIDNFSVITAECDDMWGGIYLGAAAKGIESSNGLYVTGVNYNTGSVIVAYANNSIRHSRNGIVVDDHQQQYVKLRGMNFKHCMQGITYNCDAKPALATDYVLGCTFDSDPIRMKKPFDYQSSFDQFYSEAGLNISGDVSLARIEKNLFKHTLFGVRSHQANGVEAKLIDNTFRDCYLAGTYFDNTNGVTSGVKAKDCRIYFPDYLPFTNQTLNFVYPNSTLALVPANFETFGVLAMQTQLESINNRFEWFTRDSTYATDYSLLNGGSSRGYGDRTGIYGDQVNLVISNYFRLLHAGISLSAGNPAIEGNIMLNCERGIELGDRSGVAAGVVVINSCNTFARFDGGSRSGETYGFYALANTGVILQNSSSAPIKNRFTTGGVTVTGTHHSIYNDPANVAPAGTIRYKTFRDHMLYGNFASDVQNSSVGSVVVNPGSGPFIAYNPPGPSGNGCSVDGYPNAGIQRPALAVGHLVGSMKPAAPNPVVDETLIGYVLPPGTRQAELLVRSSGLAGKLMQTVPLDAGATESRLSVRDLPAGLYFCTLLADGVPIQTQRLLVTH